MTQAKVEDIASTGAQLLSDLGSWPSLKTEASDFVEEMREYQREQFDGWTRDNLEDVQGGRVSLKTSSQVRRKKRTFGTMQACFFFSKKNITSGGGQQLSIREFDFFFFE